VSYAYNGMLFSLKREGIIVLGLGCELRALCFAKQVLYHLSHTSSPKGKKILILTTLYMNLEDIITAISNVLYDRTYIRYLE
jgi:hypothetical protein